MLLLDDLRTVLAQCAGTSGDELTEDTQFRSFEDLGYDSLAVLGSRAKIRHLHGLSISDDQAENVRCPADLLTALNDSAATKVPAS